MLLTYTVWLFESVEVTAWLRRPVLPTRDTVAEMAPPLLPSVSAPVLPLIQVTAPRPLYQ